MTKSLLGIIVPYALSFYVKKMKFGLLVAKLICYANFVNNSKHCEHKQGELIKREK